MGHGASGNGSEKAHACAKHGTLLLIAVLPSVLRSSGNQKETSALGIQIFD